MSRADSIGLGQAADTISMSLYFETLFQETMVIIKYVLILRGKLKGTCKQRIIQSFFTFQFVQIWNWSLFSLESKHS